MLEQISILDKVVVVKAKNYILKENGKDKIKLKGSSLTDSKKEPALLEMLQKIIKESFIEEDDSLLLSLPAAIKVELKKRDKTITKIFFI